MRVVVLVPRRSDGGPRDELWEYTKAWWRQSPWPVYEGCHDDGPFNRAAAINLAALEADRDGRWDVAVVADADVIGDPGALQTAVTRAVFETKVVLPYERYVPLNAAYTAGLVRGGDYEFIQWKSNVASPPGVMAGTHVSSLVVVPRMIWDELSGFDARFVGWGGEDRAFVYAAERLFTVERIDTEVFHLWHPVDRTSTTGSPTFRANKALENRYAAASKREMRALLAEADRPVTVPVVPGPVLDSTELDWDAEALQFPVEGTPGFDRGEVVVDTPPFRGVRVQILTFRSDDGELVGVFYHYPDGALGVDRGAATVMVAPKWRRQGYGSLIVREGCGLFGVDVTRQRYTPDGYGLVAANAALLGVDL